MSLDAMKQALAALNDYEPNEAHKVATALRAAIERPRQWQGLTRSEITAIELSLRQYHDGDRYDLSLADFASAIEAKLRERNA